MSDSTPAAAAQEVVITRISGTPRDAVFRAWTDPDEVSAWYGPEQLGTPRETIRIDLRVGGRYEPTMVRRDGGGRFAIGYEIVEVVDPQLLVPRSDPTPGAGMHDPTITRVERHDLGGRTRMVLTDGPYPDSSPAAAGWEQAFDKFAACVRGSLEATPGGWSTPFGTYSRKRPRSRKPTAA
jgi:uncharacterized protein YndB with AHSA1/START domain